MPSSLVLSDKSEDEKECTHDEVFDPGNGADYIQQVDTHHKIQTRLRVPIETLNDCSYVQAFLNPSDYAKQELITVQLYQPVFKTSLVEKIDKSECPANPLKEPLCKKGSPMTQVKPTASTDSIAVEQCSLCNKTILNAQIHYVCQEHTEETYCLECFLKHFIQIMCERKHWKKKWVYQLCATVEKQEDGRESFRFNKAFASLQKKFKGLLIIPAKKVQS